MLKDYEEYLKENGINIIYNKDVEEGLVLYVNSKYWIIVNENKSDIEKYWILNHEYNHIALGNLYDPSTPENEIKKIEHQTNMAVLFKRCVLVNVYLLLSDGRKKTEICDILHLSDSIYELAYDFLMKQYIERMMRCDYV